MASAKRMNQLDELDRLVNDPNVLLDAKRVWDLLDELSDNGRGGASGQGADQRAAANPASVA